MTNNDPKNTLVEKIYDAIGGFAPEYIKKVAKAKATAKGEAAIIETEYEIKREALRWRAKRRFEEGQIKQQSNIEGIISSAYPDISAQSDPSKMDNDWIANFFDKARIISDDEMQEIWARVLAGEANSPGTYSKRSVNFLSNMDKKDAVLFRNLCRFLAIPSESEANPLIFNRRGSIYNDLGIDYNALVHLDNIGLIRFGNLQGFVRTKLPKVWTVTIYEHILQLTFEKEKGNKIPIGCALLTQMGQELAVLCDAPPVEGFLDYVKKQWQEYHPTEIPSKN